jgi:hypothetical protein
MLFNDMAPLRGLPHTTSSTGGSDSLNWIAGMPRCVLVGVPFAGGRLLRNHRRLPCAMRDPVASSKNLLEMSIVASRKNLLESFALFFVQ